MHSKQWWCLTCFPYYPENKYLKKVCGMNEEGKKQRRRVQENMMMMMQVEKRAKMGVANVAHTWRTVVQEVFVHKVSDPADFLCGILVCALLFLFTRSAPMVRTNYWTPNFTFTVYRWPEPAEAKGRKIRWNSIYSRENAEAIKGSPRYRCHRVKTKEDEWNFLTHNSQVDIPANTDGLEDRYANTQYMMVKVAEQCEMCIIPSLTLTMRNDILKY